MTEISDRIEAQQTRAALWLSLALAAYFAGQVGLRLALGGALETDEAEMMVMTPGLRLGYGPQLPLYNWLQIGLFELFGRSLLALALLKNGLLFLSYLLVFLGLRFWVAAPGAAFAALSLFLLPDIAWEAQRATTHSNILLVTSAATLAAFLWTMRSGSWAAWGVLGVAIGLGGLAKYNFWLVPLGLFAAGLTLGPMRTRLLTARGLVAPAIAAAIVAGPYAWMLQNPALAFSSMRKLQLDEPPPAASGLPEGVPLLAESMATVLAVPLLAAALLLVFGRLPRVMRTPAPVVSALLLRAALVVALVMLAGVWASGMGHVTGRWLLPMAFLAVPGLFAWLHGGLAPRAVSRFYIALALLAALMFAGLTFDRFKPGARRDVDFGPLPELISGVAPMPETPVVAEFYTAGNLARARPDWRIAPYLGHAAAAFEGETVLFLLREDVPSSLEAGMRLAGWPADAAPRVRAEGLFELPYRHSDEPLPIRYVLAETPRVEGAP
ncbi:Dolichyl-phosphate-mannose-protein mannosyltransferase [Rhodovulum sp. ES.010]|uniref:ArnT family glycosyltransferase n=1 Tax=Rhodovulum sp. ES.010 TaxID=1882821 RepID=UPI0009279B76|nr:glycosyltransferase family 39 protein [Rhodovulum sp. ES.010]SIO40002.1 Dolichyl-phosphate-mannose-protein mannosyltransferase [Rhodovulum sp. ES.010]